MWNPEQQSSCFGFLRFRMRVGLIEYVNDEVPESFEIAITVRRRAEKCMQEENKRLSKALRTRKSCMDSVIAVCAEATKPRSTSATQNIKR